MKKILFAFPILCLSSCFFVSDLDNTTTHVYLKNTTTHGITVLSYYTKDSTLRIDTFNVAPGSTPEKSISDMRGLGGLVNFAMVSDGFGNRYACDSAQIVFDGNYPVSHYIVTPVITASKYYDISLLRNIFNQKSYDFSYKDSKHHREAIYIYTFSDSDYVYATQ